MKRYLLKGLSILAIVAVALVAGMAGVPPVAGVMGVARIQNNGLANLTAAWHAAADRPRHLQWGTGSGAAASANVVTTTSTTESRTAGTTSQQTTSVTNDTYRVTGTIVAAGARAITEVGAFDAAGSGSPPTGGNMGLYGDFSVINLATNDSIAFTINVVFT
jgi:hypothetical protein